MRDLIDRQEAIKALEKAGEVNYIATGDFHGIINALNVIKALPNANPTLTQHSPKWIPCSERLPEESGLYIVTNVGRWVEPVGTRYYNIRANGGFWSGHPGDKVLAWMELPAPYKEDTE